LFEGHSKMAALHSLLHIANILAAVNSFTVEEGIK
jgi:hypothetical protein